MPNLFYLFFFFELFQFLLFSLVRMNKNQVEFILGVARKINCLYILYTAGLIQAKGKVDEPCA